MFAININLKTFFVKLRNTIDYINPYFWYGYNNKKM